MVQILLQILTYIGNIICKNFKLCNLTSANQKFYQFLKKCVLLLWKFNIKLYISRILLFKLLYFISVDPFTALEDSLCCIFWVKFTFPGLPLMSFEIYVTYTHTWREREENRKEKESVKGSLFYHFLCNIIRSFFLQFKSKLNGSIIFGLPFQFLSIFYPES